MHPLFSSLSPSSSKVAWIGVGVMGRWMCHHLLQAGSRVCVHTRTPEKAQPLLDQGARWASSPQDAAQDADIVFTMLGFPSDVREAILGERGVLSALRPGAILVEMTSNEPSLPK